MPRDVWRALPTAAAAAVRSGARARQPRPVVSMYNTAPRANFVCVFKPVERGGGSLQTHFMLVKVGGSTNVVYTVVWRNSVVWGEGGNPALWLAIKKPIAW